MAVAIAIFVGALGLIASERFDRTKIALLGAVLMLLTQTIDQEHAIESVDFNTIGLLVGMMLLVRLTEPTGVYNWLAVRAGQLSRGTRSWSWSGSPARPPCRRRSSTTSRRCC
jgi:Na+/H+ antiporter NhaD/arsenite permease-like protein